MVEAVDKFGVRVGHGWHQKGCLCHTYPQVVPGSHVQESNEGYPQAYPQGYPQSCPQKGLRLGFTRLKMRTVLGLHPVVRLHNRKGRCDGRRTAQGFRGGA